MAPLYQNLRWALYDIARHPEVQRRIAQELAEAGLLQVCFSSLILFFLYAAVCASTGLVKSH